mmetsp:Transcript_32481/g.82428  ORF Transcript_32481/g.82428 Transcript_32481/m.82428 type:complete len:113 (-) Transcript_32481:295-633(-)
MTLAGCMLNSKSSKGGSSSSLLRRLTKNLARELDRHIIGQRHGDFNGQVNGTRSNNFNEDFNEELLHHLGADGGVHEKNYGLRRSLLHVAAGSVRVSQQRTGRKCQSGRPYW